MSLRSGGVVLTLRPTNTLFTLFHSLKSECINIVEIQFYLSKFALIKKKNYMETFYLHQQKLKTA